MLGFMIGLATAVTSAISASGPEGPLAGTLIEAGEKAPVVLIVPGSGPTDRDGNNAMGVTAAPYRLLSEALAAKGVSTVRIDKRGMFGSKGAWADPNAVTIDDYAEDVLSWVQRIRKLTATPCVWVLGHSEGGIITLAAVQQAPDICGIILVASPGRKMGDILREQLRANPANAPVLNDAMSAISKLEQGERVEVSGMHTALQGLFAPAVQPFLIDFMAKDPAKLASQITKPMLIVNGGRDLQIQSSDAQALAAAQPNAKVAVIPSMNHVLKDVATDDRAANFATYADASLPVNEMLVEEIAAFVRSPSGRSD